MFVYAYVLCMFVCVCVCVCGMCLRTCVCVCMCLRVWGRGGLGGCVVGGSVRLGGPDTSADTDNTNHDLTFVSPLHFHTASKNHTSRMAALKRFVGDSLIY